MKKYLSANKEVIHKIIDIIILIFFLFITNRRSWLCIYEVNKPLFYCEYGSWLAEILFLFLLLLIMLLTLDIKKSTIKYLQAWRKNGLIIGLLLLGFLSYLWSVFPLATTQRVFQLTLSTLLAAYLGVTYSGRSFLNILFWFFVFVTVASYVLVLILPGAAIMSTYPHVGAWRGVFSHRNYLGSFAALGNSIAVLTFLMAKNDRARKIVAILLFIGNLVLIIKTGSATGIILLVILDLLILVALGWIYLWGKFNKPVKTGIILSIFSGLLLVLLNIEKLLQLIGRNSTLTGRIPLWQYLIEKVVNHNIFLGFGLGTIWTFKNFREQAGADLKWGIQVVNGHNGYMDTFMYLGIIGLVLLILIAIQALVQTISRLYKQRTLISIFPFIVVMYVLITNITISFFYEFETFHWVLLVAMLFLTNKDTVPETN